MKTKITTYIFGLLALPLLWGCSSEEDSSLPAGEYPLVISAQVKAMDTPTLRLEANIGEVGIYVSGGTTYSNAKYTGTAGILTPQTQGYWRSTGNINVYGYAPYQENNPANWSVKADQSSNADYTASDYLYASSTPFAFANRENISLTFNHHLSKINITLKAGDGVKPADLSTAQVRISGTNTQAVVTLADGTFHTLSDVQSIIPHADGANKYKAIVVPQTVQSGTTLLEVRGVGTRNFGYVLPSAQTFESGRQYNYTVTVSQSGITVTPVEIVKWIEDPKDNNGTATTIYQVGDYYPEPKNAKTAIGVVFWINPASNGTSGKIVSLDKSADIPWGLDYTTDASDGTDGRVNMATIKGLNSNFSDCPAFAWCDQKNGVPGATTYTAGAKGIWYLPALEELGNNDHGVYGAYKKDKNAFNKKLEDAGGIAMNTIYWCSSESESGSGSWIVNFNNGEQQSYPKSVLLTTRCIREF